MKKKNNKKSLIIGIIVGSAIGSALSLIFAPEKGEKTRKKISDRIKDWFSIGKTKGGKFLDKYKK